MQTHRELAAWHGHRCGQCGAKAGWEEGAYVCQDCGVIGSAGRCACGGEAEFEPGAYTCGDCGEVVSKSRLIAAAVCGVQPLPNQAVRIEQRPGDTVRAGIAGVRRCRRFWCCPGCASAQRIDDAGTITAAVQGFRERYPERRRRAQKAADDNQLSLEDRFAFASAAAEEKRHLPSGGRVYLMTLTTPHTANTDGEELRRAVTASYTDALRGKRYQLFKRHYAIASSLRRLELTHSWKNGWHPHLHALWFSYRPLNKKELASFASTLRRWFGDALEERFFQRPAAWCVDVREAVDPADYLAKMGVLELAGDVDTKEARCRGCKSVQPTKWNAEAEQRECGTCGECVNRSTWQILDDYSKHRSDRDRGLLHRYSRLIRGARRLTWSRASKDGSGIDVRSEFPVIDEPHQEDLVDAPPVLAPVVIERSAVRAVLTDGRRVTAALDAFEQLDAIGLREALSPYQDLNRGFARFDADDQEDTRPRHLRIDQMETLPASTIAIMEQRAEARRLKKLEERLASP